VASRAVLITGCSSGIGHATAERLLADGYPVYATARRPESLEALAARGAITLALDVTDEESMQAAVSRVIEAEGGVGVLVNNAGYSQSGAVESIALDEVRRQFETNVFGLIRMCQLVLPGMRARGEGRIVNISSIIASTGYSGLSVYGATKAATLGFTCSLAREVGRLGINVNAVAPGFMDTEMTRSMATGQRVKIASRAALKRLAEVEDVAAMVAYLLSDAAKNITGTVMTIDAGNTA